jgi:Head domain of trimeric autotransporter adhesin/Chaperone of endosialidase
MKTNQLPKGILLFLFIILQAKTFAQMGINSTGTPPASNAMLDVSSSTKGLLMPRMTTAQRNALAHTQGLTVFDITTNGYWYSNGAAWVNLATISSASPWLTIGNDIYNSNSGNVGIGTNKPKASLNVASGKTVIFGEDSTSTGIKLIWYGTKGAFRAGKNVSNGNIIGDYSFATGANVTASGYTSTAMGDGTTASGNYSTAMGLNTSASGNLSISMGDATTANGYASTAMGSNTTASDVNSIAMGNYTKASGFASTAMGNSTTASGNSSTAMGTVTTASGLNSTAMGTQTSATNDNSTAMGNITTASGISSTAMGEFTSASGASSTAMGSTTIASGLASTAMGYFTSASGNYSTAIGNNSNASGDYSIAIGKNAATNSKTNSVCIAGSSIGASNTANNQMMMRFDNYTFFVAGTNNYAYIIPSSNGWAYTSDRNKKENFEELNGESVLKKIAKIPFYSWNFKDKTVKQYRHYGIMAQDFYNNFGKDNLGVIGNDTTVSALDLLGVAYSGIKALEKRTEDLQIQNQKLVQTIQAQNQQFYEEMEELKALIQPKRRKIALK